MKRWSGLPLKRLVVKSTSIRLMFYIEQLYYVFVSNVGLAGNPTGGYPSAYITRHIQN